MRKLFQVKGKKKKEDLNHFFLHFLVSFSKGNRILVVSRGRACRRRAERIFSRERRLAAWRGKIGGVFQSIGVEESKLNLASFLIQCIGVAEDFGWCELSLTFFTAGVQSFVGISSHFPTWSLLLWLKLKYPFFFFTEFVVFHSVFD